MSEVLWMIGHVKTDSIFSIEWFEFVIALHKDCILCMLGLTISNKNRPIGIISVDQQKEKRRQISPYVSIGQNIFRICYEEQVTWVFYEN